MNAYIQLLIDRVSTNPPVFCENKLDSAIDALYQCYSENQIDNDAIKNGFHSLYSLLSQLSLHDTDSVIDTTCILCSEYSRTYFAAGVQVGIRLMQEFYQT